MNKTKIGWVRNPDGSQGYTWNPITGCLNGCEYCYARKLANGRLKSRYLANNNLAPTIGEGVTPLHTSQLIDSLDPFYPRFWEDRVLEPWDLNRRYKAKGIFVCNMSDLFGIGIPQRWTGDVLDTIRFNKHHCFYLLTKQPQNLIKFSRFPENCFVGITVTKPEFLLPALDALDSIQCSVRYLSIEPMLARFDVPDLSILLAGSVDQVIIGAQTKPYKPPEISWVREIVEACDKAGIPVFLKDNLKPIPDIVKYDWAWSKQDKLRQEMPTIH